MALLSSLRKSFLLLSRCCSGKSVPESVIFIPKGSEFSNKRVLKPHFKFTELFQDTEKLEHDLKQRRCTFDIRRLNDSWNILVEMESERQVAEKIKEEVKKKLQHIYSSGSDAGIENREKLKSQMADVKARLQKLAVEISKEEKVLLTLLKLPTPLHKHTDSRNNILFQAFEKPSFAFQPLSHITLGQQNMELEFIDNSPSAYYLRKQLAIMELACCDFVSEQFKNRGFMLQSNTDLTRAVVLEGCGFDHNCRESVFRLESDSINFYGLSGGASLPGFVGYFSKGIVTTDSLPQKLFTVGRNYVPFNGNQADLFNCSQSVAVDAFVAYASISQEDQLFSEIISSVTEIYTKFHVHFRIIKLAADSLKSCESLAVSIEMFSPFENKYIEVGRISLCSTYISQRLLLLHRDRVTTYICIIYSQIINVTRWIGLLIENTQTSKGTYKIPKCIKPFMYGFPSEYF